ncbi:hypothetical protein KCV01_g19396, partial [Aureobasidium melanogenum]
MPRLGESAGGGDVPEREFAVAQQALGALDAAPHQPSMRRLSGGSRERPRKVVHRQAAGLRHGGRRDAQVHTLLHIGHGHIQAPGGEAARGNLRFLHRAALASQGGAQRQGRMGERGGVHRAEAHQVEQGVDQRRDDRRAFSNHLRATANRYALRERARTENDEQAGFLAIALHLREIVAGRADTVVEKRLRDDRVDADENMRKKHRKPETSWGCAG